MCFKIFLFASFLNVYLISIVFADVGQISNKQLMEKMQLGITLIDIRRPEEWKQTGVVKGSLLMTFFDKKGNYNIDKWLHGFKRVVKKDQPFILICRTGRRTGMVSGFLDRKLNYRQVNHLSKGIKNWIQFGNKVVKPIINW